MQTIEPVVCTMESFGEDVQNFWSSRLEALLERYPILEHPHKQDFYTLLLVENADGSIFIDGKKIRLDRTKAIIIPPWCINTIDINRKAKGSIVCFTEHFFSLRYNNNVLYRFPFFEKGAKPFVRLDRKKFNKMQQLLLMIMDEYTLNSKEGPKVLRSYLNIVLFELKRVYAPFGSSPKKSLRNERVVQFQKLIEQYFQTKKLPSAYAELMHITPNYLNKICKEETGSTAGKLIRNRVIIESKRLLHYTNLSIGEIAHELGFESSSYFDTFFKRNTGLTPEEFRERED